MNVIRIDHPIGVTPKPFTTPICLRSVVFLIHWDVLNPKDMESFKMMSLDFSSKNVKTNPSLVGKFDIY